MEDGWQTDDVHDPQAGNHQEPRRDGGPEQRADACRAPALDGEEGDEVQGRRGHDKWLESVRDDLQALDCGQDRDGRGDDALAEEQGRGVTGPSEMGGLWRRINVFAKGNE